MRIWIRGLACAVFVTVLLVLAESASATTSLHVAPRPRPLPLSMVQELVKLYAAKHGVPLHIAHNLVSVESGWRQNAVSRKGARGIMQLRPRTARGLRVNIYDTKQNIEGGMRYLRLMYDRFKRWDLALAAYHSGPTKVARYRGIPPKSRSYVKRILAGAHPVTGALPKTAAKFAAPTPAPKPVATVVQVSEPTLPFTGLRQRVIGATGESYITRTETVQDDVVVLRTDALVLADGVRVVRTYLLVDGVMTVVSERTEGMTPGVSESETTETDTK